MLVRIVYKVKHRCLRGLCSSHDEQSVTVHLKSMQASSGLAHNLKQIASSLSAAPSSQAQSSEQVGRYGANDARLS